MKSSGESYGFRSEILQIQMIFFHLVQLVNAIQFSGSPCKGGKEESRGNFIKFVQEGPGGEEVSVTLPRGTCEVVCHVVMNFSSQRSVLINVFERAIAADKWKEKGKKNKMRHKLFCSHIILT